MNEMKPEDVMTALEICVNGACCNECPYFKKENCATKLHEDALAIIRELTEQNRALGGVILKKDAEIERLTINMNAYGLTAKNLAEDFADYQADVQMEIADARAEAVDEFLAKAKARAREIGDLKPFVLVEYLEEIARGMKNEV